MKKSVLVIGLGRFGRHICKQMEDLGNQVMAVDCIEERVQAVLPFVTNAQIGDATDYEFMNSLGIPDFDLCVVAIGDDFQNTLEATSLLSELGGTEIVSRASRDRDPKFLLHNGATSVIYPEEQTARWAAVRYGDDHMLQYMPLEGDYGIFEIDVPAEWVGRSVGELGIRQRYHANVLAVRSNSGMEMEIAADTKFPAGCTVLVLCRHRDLQKYLRI